MITLQDKELHDFLFNHVDDMKAENIITLDVRDKSSITDFMIVCTGTSKRHVSSIASNVSDKVKDIGLMPYGVDGEAEGDCRYGRRHDSYPTSRASRVVPTRKIMELTF